MVSDSVALVIFYFVIGTMTSYSALSNAGEPTCNQEQIYHCKQAALSPTAHNLEEWGKCARDTYVSYTHVCTVDNFRDNVVYCCCVHSQKAMCCGYHRVFDQFRCSEPHDIIADVTWSPNPPNGYQAGNHTSSEEALPTHMLIIIIVGAVVILAALSIIVASVIVTRRRRKAASTSNSTCNCLFSEEEGEEKPTPVTTVPEQLQEERRPLNEPMSSEPSSLDHDCETKHIPDDAFKRSATPTAPPISTDDIYDCDNCRDGTAPGPAHSRGHPSAEHYAPAPPLCPHQHQHPATQGVTGSIQVPPAYTLQMSSDSDVFFAPGATGSSSPDYSRSTSMPAHMMPHVPHCTSCSSAPPSYEDSLRDPILPTQ